MNGQEGESVFTILERLCSPLFDAHRGSCDTHSTLSLCHAVNWRSAVLFIPFPNLTSFHCNSLVERRRGGEHTLANV